MRRLLPLLSFATGLFTTTSLAVQIGDLKDDVLFELGKPTGQMGVGSTQVLNYPDQVIKLDGGKVVSIKRTVATPRSAIPKAALPEKKSPGAESEGEPVVWMTDFRAALELAAASDREVFLFFTGSNWCSWCKRFEAEIIETPAFKAYAASKLIMVKLDFPRGVQQPEALVAQNKALSKRYRIDGYPTIVMLTSTGKFLANLGYQPGGPNPFLAALTELEQAAAAKSEKENQR